MSKHSETFLLQDEKQRERLQALAELPHDSLEAERLLCRLAAEQAMNSGSYAIAAMICATSAKIAATEIANRIKTGELLSREQAIAFARNVVDVVTSEIQGRFDGWEDAMERIGDRLEAATKPKPVLLEDQRDAC